MASPPLQLGAPVTAPAPVTVCHDVLEQIFLLLDSPADLARACAASPTFRRVITDPYFLRRFHARHSPPPLLGIVVSDVFLPAEPPHPSAAAARELVNDGGIDFTCASILPPAHPWHFCDSRDGRVLLSGDPRPEGSCCGSHRALGRPLAVCDPLHRRYLVLPAIPEDLTTSVDHGEHLEDFTAFLAPAAKDGEGDSSTSPPPFRVMCVAQCGAKLALFVFFSVCGARGQQWRVTTFDHSGDETEGHYRHPISAQRSYVHGRFYWPRWKKVLVLDARESMPGFSMMDFPLRVLMSSFLVEAAGEQERLAVVRLYRNTDTNEYHLEFDLLESDNEDRWEPEGIVFLPLRYVHYRIMDVAGGYLLLEGTPEDSERSRSDKVCFSVDLRTLRLQRFCGSNTFIRARFYAGYPPYLSPPTV